MNEAYTEATLCFPIRDKEVLPALKQKKIGAGFLNGFGGKREPGDVSIEATNIREVAEEVGITVTNALKVGEVIFHNPSDDQELRHMRVHVFTATEWEGEPVETVEMKQISWYAIDQLDYDRFLPADRLFLPLILGGKSIRATISYNPDWTVGEVDIEEVTSFAQ